MKSWVVCLVFLSVFIGCQSSPPVIQRNGSGDTKIVGDVGTLQNCDRRSKCVIEEPNSIEGGLGDLLSGLGQALGSVFAGGGGRYGGGYCNTPYGACPLRTLYPVGTSCFCSSPYGPVNGIVR